MEIHCTEKAYGGTKLVRRDEVAIIESMCLSLHCLITSKATTEIAALKSGQGYML